jgi:hypothetical protein
MKGLNSEFWSRKEDLSRKKPARANADLARSILFYQTIEKERKMKSIDLKDKMRKGVRCLQCPRPTAPKIE